MRILLIIGISLIFWAIIGWLAYDCVKTVNYLQTKNISILQAIK